MDAQNEKLLEEKRAVAQPASECAGPDPVRGGLRPSGSGEPATCPATGAADTDAASG